MEGVRLQKLLSMAGIASRRASEELILEGRVVVNGEVVMTLGTKADPAHDDIRVDGRRLRFDIRPRYMVLHKPKGYVTTRKDPEGRRTVMDLLDGVREYVYPVGRTKTSKTSAAVSSSRAAAPPRQPFAAVRPAEKAASS